MKQTNWSRTISDRLAGAISRMVLACWLVTLNLVTQAVERVRVCAAAVLAGGASLLATGSALAQEYGNAFVGTISVDEDAGTIDIPVGGAISGFLQIFWPFLAIGLIIALFMFLKRGKRG